MLIEKYPEHIKTFRAVKAILLYYKSLNKKDRSDYK